MPVHAGIIYRLTLPDPTVFDELMELARNTAEAIGWRHAPFAPVRLHSARVRAADGSTAPPASIQLAGLWLNVHFAADDLCLVFDRDHGRLLDPSRCEPDDASPALNDFGLIRTTYADADTHARVVEFLEGLAAHNLASVEIGGLGGGQLARDAESASASIRGARIANLQAQLSRPNEPFRLGGVIPFLAPTEAIRQRWSPPGPVALLDPAEAKAILAERDQFIASWADKEPDLTGAPDQAVRTLETITDRLMSHPAYRQDPTELLETHALQAGIMLGFILIEAFGGHWERTVEAGVGRLRVANLGGVGLCWSAMESAVNRVQLGSIYAHDAVFRWLAGLVDDAARVIRDDS